MIQTNFTPFPVLQTERLTLRQLEPGDAEAIYAHRLKKDVITYLGNFSHSSVEQSRAFIERVNQEIKEGKSILWVITETGNPKFIGTICLWNIIKEEYKAETGYTLEPEFHNRGYMNEALQKVISFGFDAMKLKTIVADTHKDNEPSIKLLVKNRFIQEPRLKEEADNDYVILTLTRGLR